jgi:hypothetical protein
LSDEDRLRQRLKEVMAATPGETPGDLDPVTKRGGRLRLRRRLTVGALTAACLAAVATPLVLLIGLRDTAVRHVPLAGSALPSASPLPDVARLVCDANGTHVLTPRIRPQLDGVHFGIDNRTGKHLGFIFRFGDRPGGGDNAVVGKSEITRSDVPPGAVMVTCFDYRGQTPVPKNPSEFVGIDVIDEDGIWTSQELDCGQAGRVVTGIRDYIANVKGETGDPVDLTRKHFKGLRSTDVVTRVGYPGQPSAVVAVVREGRTIATAEYDSDGTGGWLLSTVSRCQDSGLIG